MEAEQGDPKPFGGTIDDWDIIGYNLNPNNPRMLWPVTVVCCAVDLPLSIIGDTLTLPYVWLHNHPPFRRKIICEIQEPATIEGVWQRLGVSPSP